MIDSEIEVPTATIIQIGEPIQIETIESSFQLNYKVICPLFAILFFYLYIFIKIE